ncbi:MAG: hypothetical protein K0R24_40 [Gammaproteobacteria bacterium]|jgi:hypothetical protein|nr:hypothetical protein [Gammaproteobacteria bacterium]
MFDINLIKNNISDEFQELDRLLDQNIAIWKADMASRGSRYIQIDIGGQEELFIQDLEKRIKCIQNQLETLVVIAEPKRIQLTINNIEDCLSETLREHVEKIKGKLHKEILSFPYPEISNKSMIKNLTYGNRAINLIKKNGQIILASLLKIKSGKDNGEKNIKLAEEANSIARSSKKISFFALLISGVVISLLALAVSFLAYKRG